MTPEAQRIAIAEACGLFKLAPLRRTTRRGTVAPDGARLWYCEEHHGGAVTYAEVPHYTSDLNAIHLAESWLLRNHPDLRMSYRRILIDVCFDTPDKFASYWLATAAQRAEALLRTLGRWTEETQAQP